MEGEIAFNALLERFPAIALTEAEPPWRPGFTLRGSARAPAAPLSWLRAPRRGRARGPQAVRWSRPRARAAPRSADTPLASNPAETKAAVRRRRRRTSCARQTCQPVASRAALPCSGKVTVKREEAAGAVGFELEAQDVVRPAQLHEGQRLERRHLGRRTIHLPLGETRSAAVRRRSAPPQWSSGTIPPGARPRSMPPRPRPRGCESLRRKRRMETSPTALQHGRPPLSRRRRPAPRRPGCRGDVRVRRGGPPTDGDTAPARRPPHGAARGTHGRCVAAPLSWTRPGPPLAGPGGVWTPPAGSAAAGQPGRPPGVPPAPEDRGSDVGSPRPGPRK